MLGHFLPTTDSYMGLLCEAMPTNYALMGEACTVQMHTPGKIINGYVFYTALVSQFQIQVGLLRLAELE